MAGLHASAERHGVPLLVDGPGPVFQTYITDQEAVIDYRSFAACDRVTMARFHAGLYAAGVNIVPRGLWFLSTEHTEEQIDETIATADSVLAAL